ncbi:solute carrier family 66 member 3 [Anthonomus grandis grandis]|uniref:solute carrier family 66 member 3 n=1 Tax=Anthonomus grandis grandis TaxID=2921223 RepID=UPI0021656A35|nr:solute carrier family 66 member 3 [Anthonomus grandis grandis]
MAFATERTNYIQLFADFLSIITISICFILKVPQILKLLQMKTARGINLIGLLMELTSYTIMMSYNYRSGYSLLSYLEYPIIWIQELILIFLVLKYKNYLNFYALFGSGVYFSIAGGLILGVVPKGLLAFLVPLCTPIGASSKVVQLVEILKTGNAQSVSILTWFISAFTNFTRVFTITVESADLTLLLNFIINTFLSTSVMVAAIFYKDPPSKLESLKKQQ